MFQVTCLCKDKDLGEVKKRLANLAFNIEDHYVPNVEEPTKTKANGRGRPPRVLDQDNLFAKAMAKKKKTSITGPEFRALVVELGLNPSSYSYFLQNLVKNGVLKKGKKENSTMTYNLVK